MKPSEQIFGTFRRNGKVYEFKILGRGTSVLGSSQGDHVTAYALVEHGIKNALENIKIDDDNAISDPRDQRGKLYNFLSKIAALDPDRREILFDGITTALKEYNKERFKKTDLNKTELDLIHEGDNLHKMRDNSNEMKTLIEKLETRYGKYRDVKSLISCHAEQVKLCKEQEKRHTKRLAEFQRDSAHKAHINNLLICDTLTEMSRIIMTFYNHIPKTAFLKIKGFEASSSEGGKVRDVLAKLKKISENGSVELREKSIDTVVDCLSSLFHYPQIEETALAQHIEETKKLKSKLAEYRTNLRSDLRLVVSRHLFIAFAAFPNLEENKNAIICGFAYKIAAEHDKLTFRPYYEILCKPPIGSLGCKLFSPFVKAYCGFFEMNSIHKHINNHDNSPMALLEYGLFSTSLKSYYYLLEMDTIRKHINNHDNFQDALSSDTPHQGIIISQHYGPSSERFVNNRGR